MQLPIDLSTVHRPIRAKYLDEETRELARWFVFGTHDDGTVDVCSSADGCVEVFTHVPPGLADRLVAARATFADAILEILNGDPR